MRHNSPFQQLQRKCYLSPHSTCLSWRDLVCGKHRGFPGFLGILEGFLFCVFVSGVSAYADPHTYKLRTRVVHIWDNRSREPKCNGRASCWRKHFPLQKYAWTAKAVPLKAQGSQFKVVWRHQLPAHASTRFPRAAAPMHVLQCSTSLSSKQHERNPTCSSHKPLCLKNKRQKQITPRQATSHIRF